MDNRFKALLQTIQKDAELIPNILTAVHVSNIFCVNLK